jgi:hypothetical protein
VFFLQDPAPADLQRELAAMRADLAAIRAQARDGWMDDARAASVRALVADVLADSGTRASFAGTDALIAYEDGALVRSADGLMSMKVGVMNQVRFVCASGFGTPTPAPATDTTWGMENRRVNLTFSGSIVDPSITYLALVAYQSQADRFVERPGFRLMYSQVSKDLGRGWHATAGLQNVPWDLESDFFGSSRLTTGDYSIFNYRFGAGKQPGVTLRWQGDSLRAAAGVFNQLNVLEEGWNAPENLSFAVAGRVEAKFGADWRELEWMTGAPGDSPGAVLGMGLCMSNGRAQNPQPPASTPATPSAQGVTVDARVTLSGTVLIAQYAYMRDPTGAEELGWYQGANVQASTFLLPEVEAFMEAAWMQDVPVEWIAQAGANFYLRGRHVKLTVKAVVPFGGGEVDGIREISGGLGILTADNNASFVAQLQLMY